MRNHPGVLSDTTSKTARQHDRKHWKNLRDFVDDQAIEDILETIENNRTALDVSHYQSTNGRKVFNALMCVGPVGRSRRLSRDTRPGH